MQASARNRVRILSISLIVALVSCATAQADGGKKPVNADAKSHIAIRGYDPVAYFTLQRPTKGKPEFSHKWRDAVWRFANAKHRDLFKANPARYMPQFGGFCAMAMTQGVIKVIDPEAWTITNGKLYLNFSQKGRVKFRADLRGNIKKSEGHWGKIGRKK